MNRIASSILLSAAACLAAAQGGAMRAPRPIPPSADVAALLKKMRVTYKAVKAAEMKLSFTEFGDGTKVTILSDGWYMGPSSFRIKSSGLPGFKSKQYVLTTDGKQIQIDGLAGKPFAENFTMQRMVVDLPQINLEVICFWDWARQLSSDPGGNMRFSTFKLSTANWKSKSYTVLEETAKQQNLLVKYFIDPKTNLIWKTEQFRLGEKSPFAISAIDSMTVNGKVDPKQFKVTAKPLKERKTNENEIIG